MASQELKQRIKEDPCPTTTGKNTGTASTTRRDKRMAMAKRGLRSLAVAVSLPVSLTMLTIYFGTTGYSYGTIRKPIWFPPMWVLQLASMASSFFMGLAAWLIWAEGGFHKRSTAVSLYLTYLGLGLVWYPLVFGAGASFVGLVTCLGKFGALVGCYRIFKEVNPIAGDLVKPCLAWTAFLAVVNIKLAVLAR